MHFQRTSRVLLVVTLLIGTSWVAPAAAETFTATWDYDLRGGQVPDPSPFYSCGFVGSGGLICNWLWEQGLEINDADTNFPMYGDGGPYFDAYGLDLPFESGADSGDALLRIVPKCLDGIQPCFDTFTPLSMVTDADFSRASGGVFFASSRGGLLTSASGLGNFAGPEWTNIEWMEIGLFLSDACDDPESGVDCDRGEQRLSIRSLTFDADPIPEPASVVLLGTGFLALIRRYRRRA